MSITVVDREKDIICKDCFMCIYLSFIDTFIYMFLYLESIDNGFDPSGFLHIKIIMDTVHLQLLIIVCLKGWKMVRNDRTSSNDIIVY